MSCCELEAIGLDEVFGARRARRDARRYERKGLDARARRLLDGLERVVPLEGAVALEVGAGVGGLSLDLLTRRGAARATAVEASGFAAAEARRLAERAGVSERFEVRVADFAAAGPDGERYDVVVLDRVVCCYPSWPELLVPAAAAARRAVALTYPRRAWWAGALLGTLNGAQALLRRRFRVYHHPPAAMHDALRSGGLEPRVVGYRGMWELVVASRPAPGQ